MKKLITGLMLALSITAFADHPEDSDLLTNIGIGSTLTLTQDINIKPNSKYFSLGKSEKNINCSIQFRSSEKYDRVLKAGNVLVITEADKYISRFSTSSAYLSVNHSGLTGIVCNAPFITIGEFKSATKDYLKVTLAEPKSL